MVLRPEGLLPSRRRKLELHGDDVTPDDVWFEEQPSMYDTQHDETGPR